MNPDARAFFECYDRRWHVRSRDMLGTGQRLEPVRFWVLVAAPAGFAILPCVLDDGQIIVRQGKLEFVEFSND